MIGANGGATPQLLDAILWAVERGAHVISMSIGIDFPAYQQRLVASGFPPDVATSKALDAYRENVLLFERLAAMIKAGAWPTRPFREWRRALCQRRSGRVWFSPPELRKRLRTDSRSAPFARMCYK